MICNQEGIYTLGCGLYKQALPRPMFNTMHNQWLSSSHKYLEDCCLFEKICHLQEYMALILLPLSHPALPHHISCSHSNSGKIISIKVFFNPPCCRHLPYDDLLVLESVRSGLWLLPVLYEPTKQLCLEAVSSFASPARSYIGVIQALSIHPFSLRSLPLLSLFQPLSSTELLCKSE